MRKECVAYCLIVFISGSMMGAYVATYDFIGTTCDCCVMTAVVACATVAVIGSGLFMRSLTDGRVKRAGSTCPRCGAPINPGSTYCFDCGIQLKRKGNK